MSKLSENILSNIKKEHILPIPKWQFLLKSSFIWTLFVGNIILGSIATAIMLFQSSTQDLADFHHFWDYFYLVPYFWVIILGISLYAAIHNFQHTDEGYRLKSSWILGGSIVVSVLLGTLLFSNGHAGRINQFLSNTVPYYSQFADMRKVMWSQPENGRISGKILTINGAEFVLEIKDNNGNNWIVSYKDATIKAAVQLSIGEEIKMLGTVSGNNFFTATEIRPWNGGNMHNGKVLGTQNFRKQR
jgi:hypothetical protein